MYDPSIARWNGVDALAEKYGAWSPFNYVMGNPIILIDPNGMDVVVSGEEDQQKLNEILTQTFGDKASKFEYSDDGVLTFSGDKKAFSKEEKKAFKELYKLMKSKKVTNVFFAETATVETKSGETITVSTGNDGAKGDATFYSSATKNGEGYIYVNPGNTQHDVVDVEYETYYELDGKEVPSDTEEAQRKERESFPNGANGQTRTFTPFENFWHGVGHIQGGKNNQGRAIEVENIAGAAHKPKALPIKKYNLNHKKN